MINFTEDGLARFLAEDPGGPVVMLNLLRFRPDGGQQSYMAYTEELAKLSVKYGIEIIYAGGGGSLLIAEAGQEWDLVALVRYPNRQAFGDLVGDPEYKAAEHLRTEALIEMVLQPTVPITGA